MQYDMNPMYIMPEGVETRWASPENPRGVKGGGGRMFGGRKGSSAFVLMSGAVLTLAEERNKGGVIRRIWMTLSDFTPKILRSLRLKFYWDGAERPAVDVPLGDFFGIGLGRICAFQSALFSSPEGRSFNCYIPMPFRKGMKITVANESDEHVYMFFYDIDYTVGDKIADNALYFHACYRSQNPTILRRDYEILPRVHGRGRFLGCNIGVIADKKTYFNSWWGEGECKIYVDGDDEYPTLCGTGTEDYIGTGWELGGYAQMYQGCPIIKPEEGLFCIYRYHITDPVYFNRDIRVTMQQIGSWKPDSKEQFRIHGRTIYHAGPEHIGELVKADFSENGKTQPYELFERADAWSSCAYFYLDSVENNLTEMEPVEKRLEGLPDLDGKEMGAMKSVPIPIQFLKKYINNVEGISINELQQIKEACEYVIKYAQMQDAVLKNSEQEDED